jgi:hypothetical protein
VPVCTVEAGPPPLYLDAGGVAFRRPRPPVPPTPVVAGIALRTRPRAGQVVRDARVTSVLACLAALNDTAPGEAAPVVARVLVSPTGRLTLELAAGPKVLVGAPEYLPAKMWVMRKTLAYVVSKGHSPAELDYIGVRTIRRVTDQGAYFKPPLH